MFFRTEWRCFFCVACTSNKEPAKAVLVRCTVQVAPPSAMSPEHARHRHYETEQMTPRNRFDEKHDPTGGAYHLFMVSKAFGHLQLSTSFSSPPKFLNYFETSLQTAKKNSNNSHHSDHFDSFGRFCLLAFLESIQRLWRFSGCRTRPSAENYQFFQHEGMVGTRFHHRWIQFVQFHSRDGLTGDQNDTN